MFILPCPLASNLSYFHLFPLPFSLSFISFSGLGNAELLSNLEQDWVLLTPALERGDAGVQVALPSAESTGKVPGKDELGCQD